MAQSPFDHTAGSALSLPLLRAWLREGLEGMVPGRRGDAPTRHTDAEIRDFHDRNRGKMPLASDAITQFTLRAGLLGRY
jgi:hypothetical protein